MSRSVTIALLLVGTVACVEEEGVPELLVPDDLALHWDRAFNGEEDDLVALVPLDVMVYEAESGEPMSGIDIAVEPDGVAWVLPFDGVMPLTAEDCETERCAWDAWRDRYVSFLPGSDDPVATDADGLARVYLVVDAFPEDGVGLAPVPVVVTMGPTDATFQLVPQ